MVVIIVKKEISNYIVHKAIINVLSYDAFIAQKFLDSLPVSQWKIVPFFHTDGVPFEPVSQEKSQNCHAVTRSATGASYHLNVSEAKASAIK